MEYFMELATIPRPSKKEEKVRERLILRSQNIWYEYKIDKIGNIVIYVPSTSWNENAETIILQAHMDMVCVKDLDSEHNFDEDSIKVLNDWIWITADKTTLWADNWIWLAMCLAATHLENHPKLELLFTVDEEQGMSWALQLDESMLSWKKFINLDTEDEWEVCISSAWGWRINVTYQTTNESMNQPDYQAYKITLDWMQWGHSWVDIDKKRWSAIIAMIHLLSSFSWWIELVWIDWWVADNAIPSNCTANILLTNLEEFNAYSSIFLVSLKEEFDCPDVFLEIDTINANNVIVNGISLLQSFLGLEQWVISMSESIKWLVQTSLNLWVIETTNTWLDLTYAPRSSVMTELDGAINKVTLLHKNNWASVKVRSRYPGRQENPKNPLVLDLVKHYWEVLGYKPSIVAYHAWLECWAIVEKLWDWAQAVSFWPTIKDPHSTSERCLLSSVEKCCIALKSLLHSCNI